MSRTANRLQPHSATQDSEQQPRRLAKDNQDAAASQRCRAFFIITLATFLSCITTVTARTFIIGYHKYAKRDDCGIHCHDAAQLHLLPPTRLIDQLLLQMLGHLIFPLLTLLLLDRLLVRILFVFVHVLLPPRRALLKDRLVDFRRV